MCLDLRSSPIWSLITLVLMQLSSCEMLYISVVPALLTVLGYIIFSLGEGGKQNSTFWYSWPYNRGRDSTIL